MADKVKRDDNGLLLFRCPGCASLGEHSVGFHALDGRWTFDGDFERPTLHPSVLDTMEFGDGRPKRVCHSFVRAGMIQYLSDSTHAFAGRTVEVPDWEAAP